MAQCLAINLRSLMYASSLAIYPLISGSVQIHWATPPSCLVFDPPRHQIMKCTEKLMFIRVSRVADGPLYMCVAVPLCQNVL